MKTKTISLKQEEQQVLASIMGSRKKAMDADEEYFGQSKEEYEDSYGEQMPNELERVAEDYINGNHSEVKNYVGQDINKLNEVRKAVMEIDSNFDTDLFMQRLASKKTAEVEGDTYEISVEDILLLSEDTQDNMYNKLLAIYKNLSKKKQKNTFDKELAPKAFKQLSYDAAKAWYTGMVEWADGEGDKVIQPTKAIKDDAAMQMVARFENAYDLKEYDFMEDTKKTSKRRFFAALTESDKWDTSKMTEMIELVRDPSLAQDGGITVEEAENFLREDLAYSDEDMSKLKNASKKTVAGAVAFTQENAQNELAQALGLEVDELTEAETFISSESFGFETSEGEYTVVESEDVAKQLAIDQVTEDLGETPEYFNQDWFIGHIDKHAAKRWFTAAFDESNKSYVLDIKSESAGDEVTNRLAEELLKRDLITQEQAEDATFDLDTVSEKMVDEMTEDQISTDGIGYKYYVDKVGAEEAAKVILTNNLIDISAAAIDAVNVDGIGHFLSSYDGLLEETESEFAYWRTN